MSETYHLNLRKSEESLNIVLGSALGAYIGVALSLAPDDIKLLPFIFFLMMLTVYVRTLLTLQHYGREQYWLPFSLIAVLLVPILYIAYDFSTDLPMDSAVFLSIAVIWVVTVLFDVASNVVLERVVPRRRLTPESSVKDQAP